MFDSQQVRKDFPILQRMVHDRPLVYLDNAATTQKPRQVIDALVEYYQHHNANVHRGVHLLGDESTTLFHRSRQTVASFFGAQPEELVVVRNTTEAVNLVAQSWGVAHLAEGDEILVSELEHHSNLVPWQRLAAQVGATLTALAVDQRGYIDLNILESKLRAGKVKIVCLSHVSNALGTLLPLQEVIKLAKTYQAALFIDGAQAASHLPVHFDEWEIDFYAVSAHKMLGPMGIGGVFIKKSILEELAPWLVGGGMIESVTVENTSFANDLEERFTAGTPDVAGLVGWAAACEYLQTFSWSDLMHHDQVLLQACEDMLAGFPRVTIVGPSVATHQRVGSMTFLYDGVHAHDVGQILDSVGVAVRTGQHCTMPLHHKFGWPASVRVSFQLYNTVEELQTLKVGLEKVAQVFGR